MRDFNTFHACNKKLHGQRLNEASFDVRADDGCVNDVTTLHFLSRHTADGGSSEVDRHLPQAALVLFSYSEVPARSLVYFDDTKSDLNSRFQLGWK